MGKRIWIVNYYTGTPDNCQNPRYLELARRFMDVGHDVTTFNSSVRAGLAESDFPAGTALLGRKYGAFSFVHVKAPSYQGNGLGRMRSIWSFSRNLLKEAKGLPAPDVILHNIHPPFDFPVVRLAKRLHARYIAEAWDLWPEDFVTFGLMSRNHPAMKIAYSIEKKYYKAADEIVFTFLGAFDYLKRQGWMKEQGGPVDPAHLHYINNGVDLARFDHDRQAYPRPDKDMNDPSLIKIVYLGSINRANHVRSLVDAAALLRTDSRYRFFIYGDGAYREELERYAGEMGLDNVAFKERHIPLAECAWVVSQATVNVMNYEKGFGRWGVSSGKLFQYLAAGRPILCNVDIAYDNVIEDHHLGIARDIETPEEFAAGLRSLAEQPAEAYAAMCGRVREVATRFDYDVLARRESELLG